MFAIVGYITFLLPKEASTFPYSGSFPLSIIALLTVGPALLLVSSLAINIMAFIQRKKTLSGNMREFTESAILSWLALCVITAVLSTIGLAARSYYFPS